MINQKSFLKSLKSLATKSRLNLAATACLLLAISQSAIAQGTVTTDTICNDPFGAFEVASKFAKGEPVGKGFFMLNCTKIESTEFVIDPDHPQLMAAAQNIIGIFKVTHGNTTKYALAKIR